jgi:hypothetical protein
MKHVSSRIILLFIVTSALFGATGCKNVINCDRDGCSAYEHARSDYGITRGIGGFVASESDVVANGCQECAFSSAELKVWSTDTPISDAAAAQSVVDGSSATFTFVAISKYEKTLDPGHYLLCSLPGKCASVTVTETGVFTINVKTLFGPSSILLFEPGIDTPRTEGVFAVVDPSSGI